jgi:WD40 repeat protein
MRKPLAHQVTGASDKTLRQWDLATGQCVMTMDILWAISHPPTTIPAGHMAGFPVAGTFAVPTPLYADGSWDLYQDFIGAVQSWEYALVSGSGDGAVRMWDMRTGQAHRTLLGHTGPVTCLQFDEIHVVSGSLDKSVRVRGCFPLFSPYLQFASRKTTNETKNDDDDVNNDNNQIDLGPPNWWNLRDDQVRPRGDGASVRQPQGDLGRRGERHQGECQRL